MAREIGKLSAMAVAKKSEPGLYGDGGGLYLQVSKTLAKSWIFRFTMGGKRRDMGLGGIITVPLVMAREAALVCRQQVREGLDPVEVRRGAILAKRTSTAKGMTFRQCAETYISAHSAG